MTRKAKAAGQMTLDDFAINSKAPTKSKFPEETYEEHKKKVMARLEYLKSKGICTGSFLVL